MKVGEERGYLADRMQSRSGRTLDGFALQSDPSRQLTSLTLCLDPTHLTLQMAGVRGGGAFQIPSQVHGHTMAPRPSEDDGGPGTSRPHDKRLASASLWPLHLLVALLRRAHKRDTHPSKTL